MNSKDTIELARFRSFVDSGAAKSIRQSKQLSLREAGGPVSVAPSTIFRWESRERRPCGAAALRYWRFLKELMS
jgi:DNA-binding transcriptional regulator YiaG